MEPAVAGVTPTASLAWEVPDYRFEDFADPVIDGGPEDRALLFAVDQARRALADAAGEASQRFGRPVPVPLADPATWAAGTKDAQTAIGRIMLRTGAEVARIRAGFPAPEPSTCPPATPTRPVPVVPAPRVDQSPTAVGSGAALSDEKPGGPRPVTATSSVPASRRIIGQIALCMEVVGAVVLLFVAYQLWGTKFQQQRSQAHLRTQFQAIVGAHDAPGGGPQGSDNPTVAGGHLDPALGAPGKPTLPVLPGGVIARLQIPRLGLDQYVVEGTSEEDLKRGPGHYAGSPMPGQPGNAAIAGHRTTFGAPFNRLDELKPGDQILATTAAGQFVYSVAATPFAVWPTNTGVVNDYGDNRLTLTTCTPKFSAAKRLVVFAALQGPAAASAPRSGDANGAALSGQAAPRNPAVDAALRAAGGWHLAAFPLALVWMVTFAILALAAAPLRRRWPPLAAGAVLAPLWIAGLLLLFEQLTHLLPSNW